MSDRRARLPVCSAEAGPGADVTGSRAERMARYKQERRRQLAEQYGARPQEEAAATAAAPRRYITREREPGVRTTRTSRLRAAGAGVSSITTTTTTSDSGKESPKAADGLVTRTSPRGKDSASTSPSAVGKEPLSLRLNGGTAGTTSRSRRVGVVETTSRKLRSTTTTTTTTSSDQEVQHVPGAADNVTMRQRTLERQEKDKSSRRKSNLNRSLTDEVVPPDILPDEHVTHRRRRVEAPTECLELSVTPLRRGGTRASPRDAPCSKTAPLANGDSHSLGRRHPRASHRMSPEGEVRGREYSVTRTLGCSPMRVARSPDNQNKTRNITQDSDICVNGLPSHEENAISDPVVVDLIGVNCDYDSAFLVPNAGATKSSRRKHVIVNESESSPREPQASSLPSSFQYTASHRTREVSRSLSGSPVRHPSSILKKKSLDETHSNSHSPVHLVSILKRKTSRDSPSVSPVTFSPTVVDPFPRRGHRQGILKKRASLDECEVMRRRSCSPDLGSDPYDFKPILKHHRRSSLEELVRRTRSPDPQPQSILKRRPSREDELEDFGFAVSIEPQSILKRRSASSDSSSAGNSPHVSISSALMLAAEPLDGPEQVKPILKKKSSSEDSTGPECTSEVPKPILKKYSIDAEDSDDRPMKPILKTSRKSSKEEDSDLPVRHVLLRGRSLGTDSLSGGSDCEVKPILKQPSTEALQQRERSVSPRHKLSFSDSRDAHSLDGVSRLRPRPASIVGVVRSNSTAADNELSRILSRRRSLEVENLVPQGVGCEDRPGSPQAPHDDACSPEETNLPRPTSVAERILNMESFLMESRKGGSTLHTSSGAVPKSHFYHRTARSKDRFYTQPVTMEEIQASTRLESVQAFQKGFQADTTVESDCQGEGHEDSLNFSPAALGIASSPEKTCAQQSEPSIAHRQMEEKMDMSSTEDSAMSEGGLKRSDSVVARAKLFADLEQQVKAAALEAESRRPPRGGTSTFRHGRERRGDAAGRYITQPVTCDELHLASRHNHGDGGAAPGGSSSTSDLRDVPATSPEEQEGNDEEPSKLTLAERVRLFNQKIREETLPRAADGPVQRPLARKRVVSSRFKTQPVTTDEVDTAQRISTLAATLTKPPDAELLGSLSAKAVKEKIYEHASKILSKQQFECSRKVNSITTSDDKPKGILKNTTDGESSRKLPQAEMDSVTVDTSEEEESEEEVRSILKTQPVGSGHQTPEGEGLQHLKSVLKKETGDKGQYVEVTSATNEHLRSILKQESKEWSAPGDGFSTASSEDDDGFSPKEEEGHRRSGKAMDLVSILRDVEATARQQRHAEDDGGGGDAPMNRRNAAYEQEETKAIPRHSYRKARVTEISAASDSYGSKKVITGHQELRSTVHRRVEAKISEERRLVRTLVESPRGARVISGKTQGKQRRHGHLDDVTPPTSDGDTTSSSGGREVRRIISNDAAHSRKQPPVRKYETRYSAPTQQELSKSKSQSAVVSSSVSKHSLQVSSRTQCSRNGEVKDGGSHLSVEDKCSISVRVDGGIRRSYTQPMTELEQREAESVDGMKGRTSIADRLAALQKKEQDWKKRVPKTNPDEELICTVNNHLNAECDEAAVVGGGILADRKEKLDAAKQGWRSRVEPTDAVKFSVAGKMRLENKAADQPLLLNGERRHRVPQRSRFRSRMAQAKKISSTPSSPQKEITATLKRSISAPGDDDIVSDQEVALNGLKVVVPRADDETFTAFFHSVLSERTEVEQLQINDEDLDLLISNSNQLSVKKRTVKVQRRHVASRNPIKVLASRSDIQEGYLEVRTGVAEKELRRINMEKVAKNSSFAVEALAGLASKEDFASVALRKAGPSGADMLPFKDVMLLQVKGRRHVQTRLVEPVAASVNSGDSYVLVTPAEVFHWVGAYANVIERSRGAEVALHVQAKRDLGYCSAGCVSTIYEEKVASVCSSTARRFWRLLGGDEETQAVEAGHPDEDELYESSVIDTNIVYELEGDELAPMSRHIGSIPKIEMLDPSKILVFDFGSEMYVWSGKTAPLDMRRVGQRLARELWSEGYDYSECDVCPVTVASTLGNRRCQVEDSGLMTASSRPEWCLLAKVTQHMETILFREKFLDWPDFSRVIRSKGCDESDKQVDPGIDIGPCDVGKMLEGNRSSPDLELEGSHLGRGDVYQDEETHRRYEITTEGVTMWHVMEFESTQLPDTSLGQFHSADSFVVRWKYSITTTGRGLNGQVSRHSSAGRDRCAYFCWQGSEASLNEQGAAALLTVELDHERGPQVRVVQGSEPPAFLRLFQGAMVVHSGSREAEHTNHRKGWRLYVCRGEREQEAALVQVACSMRSLRSRASFVLVRTATGAVYVWHGARTHPHTCKTATSAAEKLRKRPVEMEFPPQAEVTITVQHEGSESKDFFSALGGCNRQLYVSLPKQVDNAVPQDHSPRLFHLSSLSGMFSATEVLSPLRDDGDTVVAFPFLQQDLYSASQPALFLLDNQRELWLWQGWWPDCTGDEGSGDGARGSRAVLWQMERRATMQTALDYWRLKHGTAVQPRAYLVWAGLEPLHFTNLFPVWTDRDDIAELNICDGRKPGELLTVEAELARLTRSTYPAAQLLQRPLPDGVDPTQLELYLDPSHFQELLGMTREEFSELPTWRQTNLKKEVGLF